MTRDRPTDQEASRGEALQSAHPLSFFDPEHVERPVPTQPWRGMFLAALGAAALMTIGWELYWRAHWHQPGDIKNTAALWAQERRKATGARTVLIGSSRIFFGADIDVWERASGGDRPIQLALEGTSPRIFLEDFANDEKFHGLVIADYTGPNLIRRGGRRDDFIEFVGEESLSQRADHFLSKMLDRRFAFIDEHTRPRRMIFLADLPVRKGMEERADPRKLKILTDDRNAEVWTRVMEDAAYREQAKRIWKIINDRMRLNLGVGGPQAANLSDDALDRAIAEIKSNVDKIRSRGGDVAFVRLPFEGDYAALEKEMFPNARTWDRLVAEKDSAGVSFEDHAALQNFYLPEWSHLAPREAERYTAALAPILYEEIRRRAAARKEAIIQ